MLLLDWLILLPDWLKTTGMFLGVMMIWDVIRLFIQAKVNQWVLKRNFQNMRKDFSDLEEDVEDIIEEVEENKEHEAFAIFINALHIDAKEHPEKLRTAKEVWDKEWDRLLKTKNK